MPRELPRVLVYGAAMTCGALVGLAVHIALGAAGLDLTGLWRQPTAAGPGQVRWALAWWLIGTAGVFASWLTVGLLRADPDRRGLSPLQWTLTGVLVIVLASAGRGGNAGASLGVAQAMVASLAAMTLGTVSAALSSYFVLRR
jgi:hypothetical protein